ncbi:MAG: DNA replication/repair protein RecF [Verrucomicrobiota bacterium]|nr:DNA replication/repair protein RecF [Verrucomicrobiota bacterium]
MHLAKIKLRDFRNYRRLDIAFEPGFQLLLGKNAQGKTNLLEAIYLLATLRSFRGVGAAQMIRQGQKGFFVAGEVTGVHSDLLQYYWSAQERKLTLNQNPVKRLSEFFGTLRAVVFCTEDLQIIKGSPRIRRRFMDLLLSQTDHAYLGTLQRYAKVLRSRNAVLKQHRPDQQVMEAFTRELVSYGERLIKARQQFIPRIFPLVRHAYKRISSGAEELTMHYKTTVPKDFFGALLKHRDREQQYRSTLIGPHRDELQFALNEQPVAQFGSEGQKRTLAIALKMAQAEYLTDVTGIPPVLLIDDVMGELDENRRRGLLPLLERSHHGSGQVFMTCTEENWPRELGRNLKRWHVSDGGIQGSNK